MLEKAFLLKVAQKLTLGGPLSFQPSLEYVTSHTEAWVETEFPQVFPNAPDHFVFALGRNYNPYPCFLSVFVGYKDRPLSFEPVNNPPKCPFSAE
jgi:hypothetical protein